MIGQSPGLGHGEQVGPHPIERLRADPAHAAKVFVVEEETLRLAGFDDTLGERLADSRQLSQLRPVGRVRIDLKPGHAGLGAVDLDQSLALAVLV